MKKFIILVVFFLTIFLAIEQRKNAGNEKLRTDTEILKSCKEGNLLDCSTAALISQDKIKGDNTEKIDFTQVAKSATKGILGQDKQNNFVPVNFNNTLMQYNLQKNNKKDIENKRSKISSVKELKYNIQKENNLILSCKKRNYKDCFKLGFEYETGKNIKQDNFKATQYYIKSCEGNIALGCYTVALMYSYGIGVSNKDNKKAVSFYKKSCINGNGDGCYALAESYKNGIGIEENFSKALELYIQSCRMNNGKSCFYLGQIYYDALNVPQDIKKAIKYFNKGCNRKNSKACVHLGRIYEVEKSITQNEKKAVELYKKSCDLGSNSGCTNLGNMYRRGKGIEKNYYKASILFEKSCTRKDAIACLLLGYLYEHGNGVSSINTKRRAKEYYNRACDYGELQGCKFSTRLYEE